LKAVNTEAEANLKECLGVVVVFGVYLRLGCLGNVSLLAMGRLLVGQRACDRLRECGYASVTARDFLYLTGKELLE